MRRSSRSLALAVLLCGVVSAGLSACGGDDRTVIVNPSRGSTTVVAPSGATKVCPAGQTVC